VPKYSASDASKLTLVEVLDLCAKFGNLVGLTKPIHAMDVHRRLQLSKCFDLQSDTRGPGIEVQQQRH
jgi:hypothetical protein